MKVKCKFCNIIFDKKITEINRSKHGSHFCSQTCFKNARKKNPQWFKKGKTLKCKECNTEFYSTLKSIKNGRSFCSIKCMGLWNSKNRIGENGLAYKGISKIIKCKFCGKNFKRIHTQKYCSHECFGKDKRTKIIKTCIICDKKFKRFKSQIDNNIINFCSVKCQHKYQRGSGHPRWIKNRNSLKSNKNKQYRESVKMDEWKTRIFKRDNYTCCLCKKRGNILNAHHIKPLRDNYDLAYCDNNGITLCEKCHRSIYGKEYEYIDQFMEKIKNV